MGVTNASDYDTLFPFINTTVSAIHEISFYDDQGNKLNVSKLGPDEHIFVFIEPFRNLSTMTAS